MQRISAGKLRGRRLDPLPRGTEVRPTASRVREAIFDRLQVQVVGARVLDLFAGSGALAIEALSRGAVAALLVESDERLVRHLRRQMAVFGLDAAVRIRRDDVISFLRSGRATLPTFDLVFIDPAYDRPELCEAAASALIQGQWLACGAVVVCERERVGGGAAALVWPDELEVRATRNYGQTAVDFLEAPHKR